MKAILLDGSIRSNAVSDRFNTLTLQNLYKLGYQVENIVLREKTIGNCAGDFYCWVRSPGLCNIKDDNIAIAESIINSDLVIYLTPITFGGYSSTLKKMVDHQIQTISPFFAVIEGETHHQKRYERYPDFAVIGYSAENNLASEAVFKQLVRRNAINFYAENAACEIINSNLSEDQISKAIQTCLANLKSGLRPLPSPAPIENQKLISPEDVKRAVILVGSLKTRNSTSNSLSVYLSNKLNDNHIQTEIIYLYSILRSSEKVKAMLESIDSADLISLVFQLYVDSLPAPVIKSLEIIAEHRNETKNSHHPLFTALANCGFPEAGHNTTALAICELFAKQTGYLWGGSLSLGGGGMVNGVPLLQLGGRTAPIRKALDMAAESLIHGEAIPGQAQSMIAKPVIPGWMYRLIGGISWKQQAKKYHAHKQLNRKVYPIQSTSKE